MTNNVTQLSENSIEKHLNDCRLRMGMLIRENREKRGYNQEQLAEIMKVSRSTISKIESGKFNCSIDYISKFSWFLDFEISLKYNENK